MRKLISILLLAVFGLPVVSPLFAATQAADAGLPPCCRRNGKHHCMMKTEERNAVSDHLPAFATPSERCPYFPAFVLRVQGDPFAAPERDKTLSPPAVLPVVLTQRLSIFAVPAQTAHLKRGPPVV